MTAGMVVACALLIIAVFSFAQSENLPITCGSSIKLQHVATKFRLHSHEVAYSRGSQQQSVTAYPTGDDVNGLWTVLGTPDAPCVPGDTFAKKQAVRLQHVATRKWLHSHSFQSPLSGNLEVSAFGTESQTDGGDLWDVQWESKSKVWKQDTKVRLHHRDTGGYLHSHDMKFGAPIAGQLETCGKLQKDKNNEWTAAEGVYFPANTKPKAVGSADAATTDEGVPDEL
mmetsp:Transcript_16465/g.28227  ORF Transcript_16465/g.28227 Transcript_16465/m.28227 type:complete len:227 (+) Transcript_16465:54-734(+)